MKTISFTVNLTFDEDITKLSSMKKVLNNVYDAFVHQYESGNGLAPDDTFALTEEIEIIENSTDLIACYKIDLNN